MGEKKQVGMLQGIRVLELTIWQQAPAAGLLLGALGAEVIKIEVPGIGDPARGVTGIGGKSQTLKSGRNLYFEANNLNKRSITLNLKQQKGRNILYKLVAESDIFLHNLRKDVPERLGADYATLKKHNPKLIYAAASGYGPEGPDSGRPAFDPVGLARSGFMSAVGEPGMPPLLIGGGFADRIGATVLALAILGALVARERLGIGQEIETSLLGSMIWTQSLPISQALTLGQHFLKHQRNNAPNPLYNYYQCKDGRWIMFTSPQSDRNWQDFCEALGKAEVAQDEKFSNAEKRAENREQLIGILDAALATKDRSEWITILGKYKDLIFGPINDYGDLMDDEQAKLNRYIVSLDHPDGEQFHTVGIPFTASETPWTMRPAPEYAQDTEDVLLSIGKYTWEEIAQLKDEGAI